VTSVLTVALPAAVQNTMFAWLERSIASCRACENAPPPLAPIVPATWVP
jgi:hypothetical protein